MEFWKIAVTYLQVILTPMESSIYWTEEQATFTSDYIIPLFFNTQWPLLPSAWD